MVNRQAQPLRGKRTRTDAVVALGANLPVDNETPAETVARAMDRLAEYTETNVVKSRLFRTPAFPPGAGPDFVNAALTLPWSGSAEELLRHLNAIEAEFGRTRQARWEARIMDLDLIAFGDAVLPGPEMQAAWVNLPPDEAARQAPEELILPHPRLAERAFVLVPMADVAPDWIHPVTGLSVTEMLAARPREELADIVPLTGASGAAQPLSFVAPMDK